MRETPFIKERLTIAQKGAKDGELLEPINCRSGELLLQNYSGRVKLLIRNGGGDRTRTCIAFRPAVFKTAKGLGPDPTSTDLPI